LDVSKNKIAVGILRPDEVSPHTEMIFNGEASTRRLIGRFPDRGRLRVCYVAGPTGFGLYRLLSSMGVACDVVAPSLIPKAPGDRVKTDRLDCRRLARLHRAGELVAIRVPTEAEEAVRDLCRARGGEWFGQFGDEPVQVVAGDAGEDRMGQGRTGLLDRHKSIVTNQSSQISRPCGPPSSRSSRHAEAHQPTVIDPEVVTPGAR
jgi:hypothetical protein